MEIKCRKIFMGTRYVEKRKYVKCRDTSQVRLGVNESKPKK